MKQTAGAYEVCIAIGDTPVSMRTSDASFCQLLERRYAGFVAPDQKSHCQFEIELSTLDRMHQVEEVRVQQDHGCWTIARGDFIAEWYPQNGTGRIRQSSNPFAIDTLLRIVHSILLAQSGGFLLHAASVIRGGRSFLFCGISGAGKTTISRLAPRDVTLLTDEISYIRHRGGRFYAHGTPFAGELARVGENRSAPLAALYFLEKGALNIVEPIYEADALNRLLRNILFFSEDANLVRCLFHSACRFLHHVPTFRLTFVPDSRVWELVR